MITPNELRKGLYFNVPRKDQCPFRIDVIEHLDDNFAKVGMKSGIYKMGEIEMEGHPLTWYLKDLDPIPLTEEILEKVCQIKNRKLYLHGRIIINRSGEWYDYASDVKLKHVHQLQNFIFALTNEELNLNL